MIQRSVLIIEATFLALDYFVPTKWVPISTSAVAAICWFDSIVIFKRSTRIKKNKHMCLFFVCFKTRGDDTRKYRVHSIRPCFKYYFMCLRPLNTWHNARDMWQMERVLELIVLDFICKNVTGHFVKRHCLQTKNLLFLCDFLKGCGYLGLSWLIELPTLCYHATKWLPYDMLHMHY